MGRGLGGSVAARHGRSQQETLGIGGGDTVHRDHDTRRVENVPNLAVPHPEVRSSVTDH